MGFIGNNPHKYIRKKFEIHYDPKIADFMSPVFLTGYFPLMNMVKTLRMF